MVTASILRVRRENIDHNIEEIDVCTKRSGFKNGSTGADRSGKEKAAELPTSLPTCIDHVKLLCEEIFRNDSRETEKTAQKSEPSFAD